MFPDSAQSSVSSNGNNSRRSSTINVGYKCIVCDRKGIESIEELEIHIATEHLEYYAYECMMCELAKFPTDEALRRHYQMVHQKNEFKV